MAELAPGSVAPSPRSRAGYIDWLRGLAVIIMILAHAVDSWTVLGPTRQSRPYFWFMVLAGMGAPLFLWLAGLAVPLAAHARMRRGADRSPGELDAAETRLANLRPGPDLPSPGLCVQCRCHALRHPQGGHPQHHGPVTRGRGLALGAWPYEERPGHRCPGRDDRCARPDTPVAAVVLAGARARPDRVVPPAAARAQHLHAVSLERLRLRGARPRRVARRRHG